MLVPYSRLFIGTEQAIAVSGGQVYVMDSTIGEVVSRCSILDGTVDKNSKAKGPIVAAAVNETSTHLLTVGENKIMTLWQLPELNLVNERHVVIELPKRPTGLAFTKDSQTILVSDKFGDVFSYPFDFVPPRTKPVHDEFSSHENPSDGQLVLGHASPLNAFLLTNDEKYIITADRDEHIRVSWYPQGYNIEMYCLGHRKYVSAIHIPSFATETLISGGGDPSLKLWDWMSGQCTSEIPIWEAVEPFVLMKSDKRKNSEEDDEEGGSAQKRKGKGKKSKKRAAKKAAQGNKNQGETAENDEEEEAVVIEEKVLVVNKIDSFQTGEVKTVLFSAVGVTALFGFRYPAQPIELFDFGHPVIDFTPDDSGRIWVSLDTSKSSSGGEPAADKTSFVQVTGSLELLQSLNENSVRDTKEKSLDFYADLKGMPKWSEPSKQAAAAEGDDDASESVDSSAATKSLTRREEARMKNKKNVIAKMQKMQSEPTEEKGKIGSVRSIEDVDGDDGEEKREAKRAKSEVGTANDMEVDTVA
ncbi:hypothetical protein NP233_g10997 [Leucocoprinus birnbaumii]|uniref:Transfer RNA methyltransferase 82 n=1 Tax=Leucocoprinus birnbaumii TaxID=56174 RepID=A0AAD5VN92_9AGAR|nr:hypothetical protein NP233_g10997 [Leucocoprinus birnbaumii]